MSIFGHLDILYNNVRCLSCNQIQNRLLANLLQKIKFLLNEKIIRLIVNNDKLSNVDCLNDLLFLCDITKHFNKLNRKLQGKGQISLMKFENIKIFMMQL